MFSRPRTLLLAVSLVAMPALGQQVNTDESVFAVLTHKGGFAAGRAHDHLIVAGNPAIDLEWDPQANEPVAFQLEARVEDLLVDPADLRSRLYPQLQLLGLKTEPFAELDDRARAKIRESMLSPKQLDAERYPQLAVRLVSLETVESTRGSETLSHAGMIELRIHGAVVERPFTGSLKRDDDGWTIEAVAEASFSELGIKPFSAYFGAVKNRDRFHLYLRMRVEP